MSISRLCLCFSLTPTWSLDLVTWEQGLAGLHQGRLPGLVVLGSRENTVARLMASGAIWPRYGLPFAGGNNLRGRARPRVR